MPTKRPNILLIAVDSLLATHMSCYGYRDLTTPHIDRFAGDATLFERTYCPHVPTTSAYASMLTGRDCFGTEVVALRHRGPLTDKVKTLAEILREEDYDTTCVGFTGNPSSRGFDRYLDYEGWAPDATGRAPKAHNLNEVACPELDRMLSQAGNGKPFFLFLRHMDPHSPYLPPYPFDRMFYGGDYADPAKQGMEKVWEFKPFADYFRTWIPNDCTDPEYVVAQYDGAVAYMDACIQRIFEQLEASGQADDTIVVLNGDHGETLFDHDCYFDHHGIYDVTLHVPLIIRYGRKLPAGARVGGYNQHKDLVPTLLDLARIRRKELSFDGRSLLKLVSGDVPSFEPEFYLTECTWMRKHGWRTPEWKLIVALEPDFHFKPPVELYNLITDPDENHNLARKHPDVVESLRERMENWIAKREKEEGITNPMLTQGAWHGHESVGPAFESSQQAYDTLHIGDPEAGRKLQAKTTRDEGEGGSGDGAA